MARGNRNQQRRSSIQFDPEVITEGGEILVKTAEALGKNLTEGKKEKERVTTSQIRNIYGAVKKIQMKGFDPHKFMMIKPKLAYAAGRHNSVKPLENVLKQAIDQVGNDPENFNRFVDFFEAILAYHKAYGGK